MPGYRGAVTTADVTWLDADTVQLRQPKTSHWEAPFLFLLFGQEQALLLDTGATGDEDVFALRGTVDALVDQWLARHPGRAGHSYPLTVAHTHAHGDHVAGDHLLADRPRTTVVGHSPRAVASFFGLDPWPDAVAPHDLGHRVLDVIGAPGHEPSAVVFFDRRTGLMFTGDTLCPGNLYVRDRAEYAASVERLIGFRDRSPAPVTALLGAHVEMTKTPGVDYPSGTLDQPDEAPLALPPGILEEVLAALAVPGPRVVRDRFIVVEGG